MRWIWRRASGCPPLRYLCALVIAGLVAGVPAAPGTAASAPSVDVGEAASVDAGEAPSATAVAQRTGRRVAMPEHDIEVRKVFAEPDASFTAELFAQAVQVRQAGRWVAIDTTLVEGPDG